MIFRRQHIDREVPALNTASLPDLIFTVLFFFMIVTNMRHDEVKVKVVEPDGKELTKLVNKQMATYIYIGKLQGDEKGDYQVQVDNKLMPANAVSRYVMGKKRQLGKEDAKKMIVNFKADRKAPMKLVKEVKEQLKLADARLVHYSANEKD
ncbi:MAG: biopolymer transporter ExbD [Prevotellaceae bacterium]|nr:biopolymer transporter ExbD [Prevotellaceae bacterium]